MVTAVDMVADTRAGVALAAGEVVGAGVDEAVVVDVTAVVGVEAVVVAVDGTVDAAGAAVVANRGCPSTHRAVAAVPNLRSTS